MEIELPDGTILEAPEGSNPKAVVRGYRMARLKSTNPAEYDPNSEQFLERYGPNEDPDRTAGSLRAAIGSGMTRMNRGLSNTANKFIKNIPSYRMVGAPDLPGKDFYGEEAIRAQDETDKYLSRTTEGRVGQALGGGAVAAGVTAPLGGLGALGKGGGILTRTLAAAPTRAGLEGAAAGAGAADPEHQNQGAGEGAVASAIIDTFLRGGGRTVRGLVRKNEATRDLEDIAGHDLDFPISQSASDEDTISRAFRAAYQEGMPNVLGVRGRLSRQSKEAIQKTKQRISGDDLGEALLEEITSEPVTRGSRTGRILTSVGLGGIGVYGSPAVPLTALLGGNLMATKTVQRALTGDTAAQRALAVIIEEHPEMIEPMKQLIRDTGASAAGRD